MSTENWEWLKNIEARIKFGKSVVADIGMDTSPAIVQREQMLKAIHLLREALEFYKKHEEFGDLYEMIRFDDCGMTTMGTKARETLDKCSRGEFDGDA